MSTSTARLIPLRRGSSHHTAPSEKAVSPQTSAHLPWPPQGYRRVFLRAGLAQPSLWPPRLPPGGKQQESWLKAEKRPGLATLPAELRDRLGAGMGRWGGKCGLAVAPGPCKPLRNTSPREDLSRLFENFECIFSTLGPRTGGSGRNRGLPKVTQEGDVLGASEEEDGGGESWGPCPPSGCRGWARPAVDRRLR